MITMIISLTGAGTTEDPRRPNLPESIGYSIIDWINADTVEAEIADRDIPAAERHLGIVSRTRLEILDMLTMDEEIALTTAAETDPQVAYFWRRFMAALDVRSDDPRTIQGCQLLLSKGLMTPERILEIFGVTL